MLKGPFTVQFSFVTLARIADKRLELTQIYHYSPQIGKLATPRNAAIPAGRISHMPADLRQMQLNHRIVNIKDFSKDNSVWAGLDSFPVTPVTPVEPCHQVKCQRVLCVLAPHPPTP